MSHRLKSVCKLVFVLGAALVVSFARSAQAQSNMQVRPIQSDGGFDPSIHSSTWSNGWDTSEIFTVGGGRFLFIMKSGTGAVHINRINSSGTIGEMVDERSWSTGWTSAQFYYSGSTTFMLILKKDSGIVHIHRMNSDGTIGTELFDYDWSSGYDTVEMFKPPANSPLGTSTYLFLLKSGDGTVHINRMLSDGSVGPITYSTTWSPGWTTADIYSVGTGLKLFLLKKSTGDVHIDNLAVGPSANTIVVDDRLQTLDWSSGWTSATFYNAGGDKHLMIIKEATGDVHKHHINSDGKIGALFEDTVWSDGWSNAETFTSNGNPYMFLLKDGVINPQYCDVSWDCEPGWSCSNPFGNAVGGTCVDLRGTFNKTCRPDGTCNAGMGCVQGVCMDATGWLVAGNHAEKYASSCTVESVHNALMTMSTEQQTRIEYNGGIGQDFPPYGSVVPNPASWLTVELDHVQGIGRIPGSPDENWFTASYSNEGGSGGLLFMKAGEVDGKDGARFDQGMKLNTSQNKTKLWVPLGTEHPGGVQVIGKTVVTVGYAGLPMVFFYDASNLSALVNGVPDPNSYLTKTNLVDPSIGYESGIPVPNSQVYAVGVVRLSSGRFLMVVRGTHKYKELGFLRVWFYVSTGTTLTTTGWRYNAFDEFAVPDGAENLNFVTQCDGAVYLVYTNSLGQPWESQNNAVSWHRLYMAPTGKFYVHEETADPWHRGFSAADRSCYFRAAANPYVDTQGRLVLYCAARPIADENQFGFAEFFRDF